MLDDDVHWIQQSVVETTTGGGATATRPLSRHAKVKHATLEDSLQRSCERAARDVDRCSLLGSNVHIQHLGRCMCSCSKRLHMPCT